MKADGQTEKGWQESSSISFLPDPLLSAGFVFLYKIFENSSRSILSAAIAATGSHSLRHLIIMTSPASLHEPRSSHLPSYTANRRGGKG